MKEKPQTPKSTVVMTPGSTPVAAPVCSAVTAPGSLSMTKRRTGSGGVSTANSMARKSSLEPYHDIASTVFNIHDTAELEIMFLAAARVSLKTNHTVQGKSNY